MSWFSKAWDKYPATQLKKISLSSMLAELNSLHFSNPIPLIS